MDNQSLKFGIMHKTMMFFLQPEHAQYQQERGAGGWRTATWTVVGFGSSIQQETMMAWEWSVNHMVDLL